MSDNETGESDAPTLDHDAAVELDESIQRTAGTAGEHLDDLFALLEEAKAGQIHEALDFPSWTAYLVDRLRPVTKALDADDRRALVVQLYEAGMSYRDISATTGVPRSTVGDQVSEFGHVGSVTHGHDGKVYPRNTERDTDLDAEESDESATQQDSESNNNGGYRGKLTPPMRLNRAVKAIEGIDVSAAKDQAVLRQQMQDARKLICELIDERLASIEPVSAGTESN